MKKISLFALPFIAIGLLTGCNNGPKENICELALDAFPTLIGFSSGNEVFTSEDKVIKSEDLTAYLGLTSVAWKGTPIEVKWDAAPADKWSISSYQVSETETRQKFMPKYGEEEFDCSLTVTYSVKGQEATRKWNFHTEVHTKPDLSEYTYMSISDIQDAYAAQGYGASISPTKVYTYGKIVKTMENNDQHLYTGVFIQDGNKGLQLYAGQLSKVWFAVGFEVGDVVMAYGVLSPYNALLEMKPDGIEYASVYADAPAVAEPVVNDITDKAFTLASIGTLQTSMVEFKGLTFKKVKTKPTSTVHGEIIFTKGTTEIPVYVNYHLGVTAINGINEFVDKLTTSSVVDFTGILTAYNNLQLLPIDGAASFKLAA